MNSQRVNRPNYPLTHALDLKNTFCRFTFSSQTSLKEEISQILEFRMISHAFVQKGKVRFLLQSNLIV